MKSENWIIVELGSALLLLTVLGFFRTPAYEKLVWFAAGTFSSQFCAVVGYKFGRSLPQQVGDAKPGQSSQTDTTTRVTAPDPAPPADTLIGKQ